MLFRTLVLSLLLACGQPSPSQAPTPTETQPTAPANEVAVPLAADEAPPVQAEPNPTDSSPDASTQTADAGVTPAAASADCCCHHTDPAGAGLSRFSRDQGTCDGSIYMKGCVDSGICDVATTKTAPKLARFIFTLPSGKKIHSLANPSNLYDHGEGAIVLYIKGPKYYALGGFLNKYMYPPGGCQGEWVTEAEGQTKWRCIQHEENTEAHGIISRIFWKVEQDSKDIKQEGLAFDVEENCQGGTGTCIWLPMRPIIEDCPPPKPNENVLAACWRDREAVNDEFRPSDD